MPRGLFGAAPELEKPVMPTLTPLTYTLTLPLAGTDTHVQTQFVIGATLPDDPVAQLFRKATPALPDHCPTSQLTPTPLL
jgi:hypothetical protein